MASIHSVVQETKQRLDRKRAVQAGPSSAAKPRPDKAPVAQSQADADSATTAAPNPRRGLAAPKASGLKKPSTHK